MLVFLIPSQLLLSLKKLKRKQPPPLSGLHWTSLYRILDLRSKSDRLAVGDVGSDRSDLMWGGTWPAYLAGLPGRGQVIPKLELCVYLLKPDFIGVQGRSKKAKLATMIRFDQPIHPGECFFPALPAVSSERARHGHLDIAKGGRQAWSHLGRQRGVAQRGAARRRSPSVLRFPSPRS